MRDTLRKARHHIITPNGAELPAHLQNLAVLADLIYDAYNLADDTEAAYRSTLVPGYGVVSQPMMPEVQAVAGLLYDAWQRLERAAAPQLAAVLDTPRQKDARSWLRSRLGSLADTMDLSDAEHEANIRALEDAHERDDFGPGADGALAAGVEAFGKQWERVPVGGSLSYCLRCNQPFSGEACPRCDPAGEGPETEDISAARMDGLEGLDPRTQWDGEKWVEIAPKAPGELWYMSPCCAVGMVPVGEGMKEDGLIIECGCGRRYRYEDARGWTLEQGAAGWCPVDMDTATLASDEEVAAYEAAQDRAKALRGPLSGYGTCAECGKTGELYGSGHRCQSCHIALQQDRESQRRQRANFNAIADGLGPIYPDEY